MAAEPSSESSLGGRDAGPLLLVGGGVVLLLALGILAVALAWSHAAGTPLVPLQVPAVAAAMVGVGLVGTGLAVLDLHLGRRQGAEEDEALGAALTLVRRWGEHDGPVRTD